MEPVTGAAVLPRYDVVVMGGGPSGSTVAALVAQAGHEVLLLERDHKPRFKIGESLMPGTFETLDRLGMVDRLRASAFPRKYSVQFIAPDGRASAPFYFDEYDPRPRSQTWQVLRSEFDSMLLTNAAEKGARIERGVSVRSVLFEGSRAVGVRAERDGQTFEVAADVIVDATGQSAFLARSLALQNPDPVLRKAAIFTHVEGALRDSGRDEGATLVIHTREKKSWFWFIPLANDRVSVGVVGAVDYLLRDGRGRPQEVFDQEVAACPGLLPRLQHARQVMEIQVMREFSYSTRRGSGDGWLTVGDAYGFLDPIYSTGVLLAFKSGEAAADAVIAALAAGDTSAARLGVHVAHHAAGMDALRQVVCAFYTPEFSFARFLRQYPEYRKDIIDVLSGDVFDRDFTAMFAAMAPLCATAESVGPARTIHEPSAAAANVHE